ncbi:hypothetical protein [Chitinophaga filiformis]|uniref:GLPGLI family protein n=1 Tax=Chitinophaga filiformis TaxID=104663 RepID=A0A1G7QPG0_CHIFI|nr:hypothetical protein [Chitinophaga filiformis]SDG00421.1 hypothetical protein SAMN04488121_103141 [Chitinophaga filiformis]
MTFIPKAAIIAVIALSSAYMAEAQKIKTTEGSLSALKGQTEINVEYEYDHLKVGEFDKEEDYIQKKKDEYNKKEPGKGDTWETAWKNDRTTRYAPKFEQLFAENSGIKVGKFPQAKYTLIFKTTFIEPGFNVGVAHKNAYINGEIWVVETADHSKVIAKSTVDKAPGRLFAIDFDSGVRIGEAYAATGKVYGKQVKKEVE